ncbi:DUF445 domain-containing protein [Paenibacillus hamazuiensis]|uniref:DUF445 domain-containing protein n=1 Tax=Paenibacillus hamazuiensis TaxID=2936508 RepID=UPI00200C34A7|nr:DUF445 domain-containing protein [Paenibacillus hamazuiensis]
MESKNKYIAGISLGVMAAGFAVTLPLPQTGIVPYLQGAFEAGLVGGLADWFAVTALFRHPLGIPVPHTSLLVKNRDKLTKALVSAVETELLNQRSITEKLKGIPIAERMLNWADNQLGTEEAARAITAACSAILQHLPYERLIAVLKQEARGFAEGIDVQALFDRAAQEAIDRGWDRKALDYLLDKAESWIIKPETQQQLGAMALKALGNIQLGGFMGFAMGAFSGFMTEDKLGGIIQSLLLNGTANLRRETSEGRQSLLTEIRSALQNAPQHPELAEGIESLKRMAGEYAENSDLIDSMVMKLKARALHAVEQPEFAGEFAVPFLKRLIASVSSNAEWMDKTESWIKQKLLQIIADNHNKIGVLVKENVDKLDNATLIAMLEDKIGKDLQWIRVNGALCGFLIGLLLTVIKTFAG